LFSFLSICKFSINFLRLVAFIMHSIRIKRKNAPAFQCGKIWKTDVHRCTTCELTLIYILRSSGVDKKYDMQQQFKDRWIRLVRHPRRSNIFFPLNYARNTTCTYIYLFQRFLICADTIIMFSLILASTCALRNLEIMFA